MKLKKLDRDEVLAKQIFNTYGGCIIKESTCYRLVEIIEAHYKVIGDRIKLIEQANKAANKVIEEEINLKTKALEKIEELGKENEVLREQNLEAVKDVKAVEKELQSLKDLIKKKILEVLYKYETCRGIGLFQLFEAYCETPTGEIDDLAQALIKEVEVDK